MKITQWKRLGFVLLLPAVLLLTSCSNKKVVDLNLKYLPSNEVPAQIVDTQAQAQIAEAANTVGHSLQELSAVQMTVHPPKKLRSPYNPNTIGMGKLASVSWNGPVEPLLRKIARASRYHLNVIGRKPAIPVLVSVNIQNQPIANILRNVTYQVVMKATIAIYPRSRIIELRYNGN